MRLIRFDLNRSLSTWCFCSECQGSLCYCEMKSELFALLFCGFSLAGCTLSSVDCDFNQKPHFCGWKREWFGTRRASWRVGWKIRRASVKDVSKEGTWLFSVNLSKWLTNVHKLGLWKLARFSLTACCLRCMWDFWVVLIGSKSHLCSVNWPVHWQYYDFSETPP